MTAMRFVVYTHTHTHTVAVKENAKAKAHGEGQRDASGDNKEAHSRGEMWNKGGLVNRRRGMCSSHRFHCRGNLQGVHVHLLWFSWQWCQKGDTRNPIRVSYMWKQLHVAIIVSLIVYKCPCTCNCKIHLVRILCWVYSLHCIYTYTHKGHALVAQYRAIVWNTTNGHRLTGLIPVNLMYCSKWVCTLLGFKLLKWSYMYVVCVC